MLDNRALDEQTNIQHAIIGDVMTSLPEILESLTKSRLATLASVYNVAGRSKMKKNELSDALQTAITDAESLESILMIANAEEWELFNSLQGGVESAVINHETPYGYYAYFMDRGLLFSYFTDNKLYLIIPEEVKRAYASLNNDLFKQKRERYQLVHQYVHAAAELYGAITPEQLADIFNAQNETPLSAQELTAYVEHLLVREQDFDVHDGYIVSSYLIARIEENEFAELLKKIKNKPRYVPERDELLKYADYGYFEMTPELEALKDYILKNLIKDEEMVEYLIDDIQLACSMESSLQDLIHEFERRNIVFRNMEQAQQVIALLIDVYNHTRLWSNAGHMPAELAGQSDNSGKLSANAPVQIRVNNQISVKKVGRNEPCPCGSGLKYKKCCGK